MLDKSDRMLEWTLQGLLSFSSFGPPLCSGQSVTWSIYLLNWVKIETCVGNGNFILLNPLFWLVLQASINWNCINIPLLYFLGWTWQQLLRYWPACWGEHIHGGRARHRSRKPFLAPLQPGSEPWASGKMPGGDQGHSGGWIFHHLVRFCIPKQFILFSSWDFAFFFLLLAP